MLCFHPVAFSKSATNNRNIRSFRTIKRSSVFHLQLKNSNPILSTPTIPYSNLRYYPKQINSLSQFTVRSFHPTRPILNIMEQNTPFENRLAKEKSPYLLQHKTNPVDWYPWGEEAFEKARKEDKPIFLSVGYSTCHWCHVMAHESFENPSIAEIMNKNFVNIKLDREERPDIDKMYMTFVQAITGGGGWPMSVWLTPDLKPIYGGTYFPPNDAYGRPGFPSVLKLISENWKTKKNELISQGDRIISALQENSEKHTPEDWVPLNDEPLKKGFQQISKSFDPVEGGFSKAPKFPRPVVFDLLFQIIAKDGPTSTTGKQALHMVELTLTKMGEGGMFDHLTGGFHRYSVTSDWHIPHFEKMLYDQGQLVVAYLTAFQLTKNPFYEDRAREVMNYVTSITSPEGGFYSAEDADSLIQHGKPEHAEGAFYVFTYDEILEVLGETKANVFNYRYGVKKGGNVPPHGDPHGELTGKNHLKIVHSLEDTAKHCNMTPEQTESLLNECRKQLAEYRSKRPKPHLDDKIITAWNGLMISAYAKGYQVLHDEKYLNAAKKAAVFIRDNLYRKDTKTLIRNYRQGPSSISAFADDYAFLIASLLDLYEASFDLEWLEWAITLQQTQDTLFWDTKNYGYFTAEKGDKSLLIRMKEDYDGAEPCNNSVSAMNLLRLSQFTGREEYRKTAEKVFTAFIDQMTEMPLAVPYMCRSLAFYLEKPKQIIIAGTKGSADTTAMIKEIHKHFIPNKILMLIDESGHKFFDPLLPFVKDMKMINDKATAFVCENFTCQLPVNNVSALASLLVPRN